MIQKPKKSKIAALAATKVCLACLNTIPDCSCESDKALMAALGFKHSQIPLKDTMQGMEKTIDALKGKGDKEKTLLKAIFETDTGKSQSLLDSLMPKSYAKHKAKKALEALKAESGAKANVVTIEESLNPSDVKGSFKKKYSDGDYAKAAALIKKEAMAAKKPFKIPKFLPKKIAFHDYGDCHALMCPQCEGYRLKQTSVTVYERATDAAPIGTAVTINKEGTFSTEHLMGNPSPRKNAVVITFECIDCGVRSDLTLANHKGVTDVHMGLNFGVPND
jgi:hypothetical protein